MRKVILMVALMVVSGSAMAEWVKWNSTDTDIIYVADKIRSGNLATMSVLFDSKTKEESAKFSDQYDCKNGKSRRLAVYLYFGHMGTGESQSYLDVKAWESNDSAIFKEACGIK